MSLTNSSINCFKQCRRKYYYQYVLLIEPFERPTFFDVGAAFHIGLENLYNNKSWEEITKAIEDYFQDNRPEPEDAERFSKWEENLEFSLKLVERYYNYYPEIEPFEVLATEMKFRIPILNPDTGEPSILEFEGKVDGLIKEKGRHWLLEHKTTISIDERYKRKLFLDSQCIYYLLGAEQMLNITIHGVLYNVALKSIPRPPQILKKGGISVAKNQNTTYDLAVDLINELELNPGDYLDFLDWLKKNEKQFFYRQYLHFPEEQKEEFKRELWQTAMDIIQAEKDHNFYMNTSQCTLMSTCPYFEICCGHDKQIIIDTCFKKREHVHSELIEPEDSCQEK